MQMEDGGKENNSEVEITFVAGSAHEHFIPRGSCNLVCPFTKIENSETERENREKSLRKLSGLMIFYFVVMMVEVVGGLKANSLAVLADAAHMLTDVVGLSISLFAVWASGWKATNNYSFGFNRLEVLGALFSLQLIWSLSGMLIYEAFDQILHKGEAVNGKLMFSVAAFGFLVNVIMVTCLGHDHHVHHHVGSRDDHHHHHHDHHPHPHPHHGSDSTFKSRILNINLHGAYLHIMGDLIQSVGVMIAGAIIWVEPRWLIVDLISTLVFSVVVFCTTIPLLKSIFYVLMERTPVEIDVVALREDLRSIHGVDEVRDLHVWAVTLGRVVMTCHVVSESGVSSSEVVSNVRDYCRRIYKIQHVTIQLE